MWNKFKRNKLALIAAAVIFLEVLLAIFAPLIAPYDPREPDYVNFLKGPGENHLLGTDDLGRDVFSRLIYGIRVSLSAGLISVLIALAVGIPIGLIAGYYRGFLDEFVIMRFTDAMMSLPSLVLALALSAIMGAGLKNAMIAIGIIFTPRYIRLVRGEVLSIKEAQFVEAAKSLGMSDIRILFKHILPNIMSPILVQATLSIASGIIVEASLSYLGLGTQPPIPSWGTMLSTGQGYLDQAPWIALSSGMAIFISVLAFNLMGDGLRDMLDPKI
ncbi:ABC transporter permease [Halanaerobium sp. MA284_MarDTE_T2]|uniref:ABC transporter permease n=1 Tax=Halanaerobium sp. MA284_MarDTE_T2 TaxID=2183913 RepID=UPI000DF48CF6|nr:ABC transporter permease [Halanaerobium sp. MA284_MarDTE_T2]RCW49920.1 peptide/nickel transport system permease protein/oligopeptide transport system permease protein [Halanaerobium sp. MA284_MarDTE_T2]